MPENEMEYRSSDAPKKAGRNLREVVRRMLYGGLLALLIASVVYLFVVAQRDRRRMAGLYLQRAKVALTHDEFEKASEELKNASLEDPANREILKEQLKTEIFQFTSRADSLQQLLDFEKLNKAEQDCKNLLSNDAGNSELLALLGLIYSHKDQPILAMQTFESAAQLAPRYANVRNYWAYSAYQWKYPADWQQLVPKKLNEAKEIDPAYLPPKINLARLETDAGKKFAEVGQIPLAESSFGKAIKILDEAQAVKDNKENLYIMWAITLDEWGRALENTQKVEAYQKYAESLEKYRLADSINPNRALIHFNKANALADYSVNDTDDAIREYVRALELDPTLYWAHVGIAVLLANRPNASWRDFEEASTHLEKAIALESQMVKQYEVRKIAADTHARNMLDDWTERRNDQICQFQRMLESAHNKQALKEEPCPAPARK